MPHTDVSIRMDENLVRDFNTVCAEMGLTMTDAITVFVKSVAKKSQISHDVIESEMLNDISFASEKVLSKDWLLPEEDEAWANL